MALDIDFDGDIAQAVTDLPGVMKWNGKDYFSVIDPVIKAQRQEGIEGIYEEDSFQIVVQTSLFSGSRPVRGETVTVKGTVYRIVRVETDEADAGLNIFVEEETA